MNHANPTCFENKSNIPASLRRPFLIFSLAVAISVMQWSATTAFSLPGLTSTATAFQGALIGSTSNENVGHLSDTALGWNTEEYDTNNFHSGSNNYFVIPAGVTKVRVSGSVLWSANTNSGSRFLYTKTDNQFAPLGRALTANKKAPSYVMGQSVHSAVMNVSQGQIIRLHADQDSGITTSVIAGNNTWFAIQVVP